LVIVTNNDPRILKSLEGYSYMDKYTTVKGPRKPFQLSQILVIKGRLMAIPESLDLAEHACQGQTLANLSAASVTKKVSAIFSPPVPGAGFEPPDLGL
jgi:hypothetical protein